MDESAVVLRYANYVTEDGSYGKGWMYVYREDLTQEQQDKVSELKEEDRLAYVETILGDRT